MGFERLDTGALFAMKTLAKRRGKARQYAALDREIKRREARGSGRGVPARRKGTA